MNADTVNKVRVPAWRLLAALLDPDEAAGGHYAMNALREAIHADLLPELVLELAQIAANEKKWAEGRAEAHSLALQFIHYRLDLADEEQAVELGTLAQEPAK